MRKSLLVIFCLVFASLLIFGQANSKIKKATPLGKYDFYHYYTYPEMTSYLQDMHAAYPELTKLTSLCKSPMGRDVWMLTINNPSTGKAEEKPGFFINQIHSSEVIASMSSVYTIWYLLENYGKDKEVSRLVDGLSWYFVPRLDVDGAEAYLTGKPAGDDPDPEDSDGDSRFDEDPSEDIDGDGTIVQMRQKDPEGTMKISNKNPRIMVRKAPDETDGVYYKLYSEGLDNDGDGKINEDGFRTRFLSNRNYPGNWQPQNVQSGGGTYPLEESITRAEVEFVAQNPHIALYVQHHCCGRVILRPPTTQSDSEFKNQADLELYKIASARALEHSRWDLATSIFDWNYPPGLGNKKSSQIYRDKSGRIINAPSGMYPEEKRSNWSTDFRFEDRDPECEECDEGYYAWGSSIDTMYLLFGIFSMGDEHWNPPDYDKDGSVTEEERLKWNDEELDDKLFVDWHPFDHPTLGEVEIGGWRRIKTSPPEGELIQKECEMGNGFVIYLAGLAPRVKVGKTEVVDKEGGIFQVDITVENTGFLPTATQQAQNLSLAEPVKLSVEPGDNVEILFGEEKIEIGQIDGHSESEQSSYIVRVKDVSQEALLRISVNSQKAGRDSRDIVVK
jgi:murein tripeptide amidase MpaA